jgi:hypothetical protein
MIKMSIPDVIDRYCITYLKYSRVSTMDFVHELNSLHQEFYNYFGKKRDMIWEFVRRLSIVHEELWDTEASIRAAQEEDLGLEEVGRRALKVRDLNRERQRIKNEIIDYFGEGYKDCKVNYSGSDT